MQISPRMGIGSISTVINSNRVIKHFILAIEATRFMERKKPVKERMPYINPFQREQHDELYHSKPIILNTDERITIEASPS